MNGETALGVVHQPEVFACFLNRDYVHESCWVGDVGADFAVHFDQTLHDDGFGFAGVESVL